MSCAKPYALRGPGLEHQSTWVTHVEPLNGSRFVLRDTPVLLRFSRAADPTSVQPGSVRVADPAGEIPCRLRLSADGCVVIWESLRLLTPGVEHVVRTEGLKDTRGREIQPIRSQFTPCGFARADFATSLADGDPPFE